MTVAPPRTVIVVADEDVALCALLAELLAGEGRVIDVIDCVEGLTAEMIALSQPRLVILNPRTGNLPLGELQKLVADVRTMTSARFILMLSEADSRDQAALQQMLRVDGTVPIQTLLRDPLAQLVEQHVSGLLPAPSTSSLKKVDQFSVDDILGLELDDKPLPKPQVSSHSSALAAASRPAKDLTLLIEEELEKAGQDGPQKLSFTVALDTLGDANLVDRKDGTVIGVYVPTVYPPPLGALARVTMTFPWQESVVAEGVVVWTRADDPFSRRRRLGVGVIIARQSPEFVDAAKRFASLRKPMTDPKA
jgi:hypothetical protein